MSNAKYVWLISFTFFFIHTVRKSLIVSKNSILRKIKNLDFWAKINDFLEFLKAKTTLIFWILVPKIVIFRKHRFNKNWKMFNFNNFWHENSNYNRNEWITNHNYSLILTRKFKFTTLFTFLKLEFLTVCYLLIEQLW